MKFIQVYDWQTSDVLNGKNKLGTMSLINLDTVAELKASGSNPPGTRIIFKRDEAREAMHVLLVDLEKDVATIG